LLNFSYKRVTQYKPRFVQILAFSYY